MTTAPRAGAQVEARKERKKGPVSAAQHLAHGLPPPGPVLHAVLCTSPPRTERALQDLLLDKVEGCGRRGSGQGVRGWKGTMNMVERRAKGRLDKSFRGVWGHSSWQCSGFTRAEGSLAYCPPQPGSQNVGNSGNASAKSHQPKREDLKR